MALICVRLPGLESFFTLRIERHLCGRSCLEESPLETLRRSLLKTLQERDQTKRLQFVPCKRKVTLAKFCKHHVQAQTVSSVS